MKDSLRKLKELRETLCTEQQAWRDAFAARDKVVEDLRELYSMCLTKGSRKKQIEKKILVIFEYLEVAPTCNTGDENASE